MVNFESIGQSPHTPFAQHRGRPDSRGTGRTRRRLVEECVRKPPFEEAVRIRQVVRRLRIRSAARERRAIIWPRHRHDLFGVATGTLRDHRMRRASRVQLLYVDWSRKSSGSNRGVQAHQQFELPPNARRNTHRLAERSLSKLACASRSSSPMCVTCQRWGRSSPRSRTRIRAEGRARCR